MPATVNRGVVTTPIGAMHAEVSSGAIVRLLFVDEAAPRGGSAADLTLQLLPADASVHRSAPSVDELLQRLQAELDEYFAGRLHRFTVPVAPEGTPFQQQVWRMLQDIPYGVTRSYGDQARIIGRPTATRAVARVNGDNPIAIIIPCHRVVGANGRLTGYGGGLWRKQRLLDLESGSLF